jgi:ribosomal protein S18 acetylase RimI-like enzyme
MRAQIVVREATCRDIPAIVGLWKELLDFHKDRDPFFARAANGGDVFAQFIEGNIRSEAACVYVAVVNNQIVGYCQGMLEKHPPVLVETEYGHILDIMVTANSRRTGAGEKMVSALRDWFRLKGVHRIEVRRLISNEIASQFWAKMGFEPYLETLFVTY